MEPLLLKSCIQRPSNNGLYGTKYQPSCSLYKLHVYVFPLPIGLLKLKYHKAVSYLKQQQCGPVQSISRFPINEQCLLMINESRSVPTDRGDRSGPSENFETFGMEPDRHHIIGPGEMKTYPLHYFICWLRTLKSVRANEGWRKRRACWESESIGILIIHMSQSFPGTRDYWHRIISTLTRLPLTSLENS